MSFPFKHTGWGLALVLLAAAPAPVEIEPEAMETLQRWAQHLAKTERFSFTAQVSYDAVQEDGLKVEFGGVRRGTVRRPDHVHLLSQDRDGDIGGMVFDGKRITVFNEDDKVYAQVPKTGTLDTIFDYLVEELDTPMPLHELVYSNLPGLLHERIKSADVVGYTKLGDMPCEHFAARGDEVDVQFWIEEGKRPLLRRLVITYRDAPGEPQFRADLVDWDLAPEAPDALFEYTPPKDFERIRFLAQARPPHEEKP